MVRTKRNSPIPRQAAAVRATEFQYPTVKISYLPIDVQKRNCNIFTITKNRRTRRRFKALPLETLGTFLWYSWKTGTRRIDQNGRSFEFRPAPSAGACHPHDLIIFRKEGKHFSVSLYNPLSHALMRLNCIPSKTLKFVSKINQVLPIQQGTILWLGCQSSRTESAYRFSESLLWRDAGVLLGVMALVAEGLGLAFCPLGITGEPHLSGLFKSKGHVEGFGGAILGV